MAEEEFVTVEDGERSTVLDAMALLGGNEYLVQQMIERLSETQYNEAEAAFIRASLGQAWGGLPPDLPGQFSLSQLLTYLTPLHRDRLERLLASCLLYCSRSLLHAMSCSHVKVDQVRGHQGDERQEPRRVPDDDGQPPQHPRQ